MRVLVTASARFARTSDGNLWTGNASLGYPFWARYLDVFCDVELMARTWLCDSPPDGWNQVTGPHVTAVSIPNFTGPLQYLRMLPAVKRIIRQALVTAEAIELRVSCPVGEAVWRALPPGRPYGVEVIGDPYDSFAPGSVKHPLRPFFRWWFPRRLRAVCAGACAAAYVTSSALQKRYPCPRIEVGVSDVHLPDSAYSPLARGPIQAGRPCKLITVGTLAQLYKAPDALIDAVGICIKQGLDLELVMIGDGKYRSELLIRARTLGLGGRVRFAGQLASSEAVRVELDASDLFVLPSRQEGMPRAMLEAMARGLPCIGSRVGGVPELLPAEDLVPAADATALAAVITAVLRDPERQARMSGRNLAKARLFHDQVLRERRMSFYAEVRDRTETWIRAQASRPSNTRGARAGTPAGSHDTRGN